MIYSSKTFIFSLILILSSFIILATMSFPIIGDFSGFEHMERTFNSLRKGASPPFEKIDKKIAPLIGKKFSTTIHFDNLDEFSLATTILLRNNVTIIVQNNIMKIKGDFGYLNHRLLKDIYYFYYNQNSQLIQKYSHPTVESMYVLNLIYAKMEHQLLIQNQPQLAQLINLIRNKLLEPAYNLRKVPRVSNLAGFLYLSIGTLVLLLIALLWDFANLIFFNTINSDNFLKDLAFKFAACSPSVPSRGDNKTKSNSTNSKSKTNNQNSIKKQSTTKKTSKVKNDKKVKPSNNQKENSKKVIDIKTKKTKPNLNTKNSNPNK